MVCKSASQRDAVWAYGSSGEEMLGATCSWVTGDGRWEAHSQLYLFWLSFIFGYLFWSQWQETPPVGLPKGRRCFQAKPLCRGAEPLKEHQQHSCGLLQRSGLRSR